MIRFLHKLKAAWTFSRHQHWVQGAGWEKTDAIALNAFFRSETGKKLKDALLNTVLMQNASALVDKNNLPYSAGFAMGQASLVKVIEVMADESAISDPGTDPDQGTIT